MRLDIWLGLLSTAASLAGLAWNRDGVRKLALALLTLLSILLVAKGILYQRTIVRVQTQIVVALGTSEMTADQLYENVYTTDITRPLFDAALNNGVEARQLSHRIVDIRTPDNVQFRVRVYSTR